MNAGCNGAAATHADAFRESHFFFDWVDWKVLSEPRLSNTFSDNCALGIQSALGGGSPTERLPRSTSFGISPGRSTSCPGSTKVCIELFGEPFIRTNHLFGGAGPNRLRSSGAKRANKSARGSLAINCAEAQRGTECVNLRRVVGCASTRPAVTATQ